MLPFLAILAKFLRNVPLFGQKSRFFRDIVPLFVFDGLVSMRKPRVQSSRPVQSRTIQKAKVQFPTKRSISPTQEGLGDSPPCKRQKINSAPPSEGAGNLSSNVITHDSVPDWVKTTLRPLNLHTPCSVPFPPISFHIQFSRADSASLWKTGRN